MSDIKATAKKIVGFVTDATVEAAYRKYLEAAKGQPEIITMLELEYQGGRCPLCEIPFVRVDVENRFGEFHYYKPQCHCYKRCQRCGRDMIAERFLNIYYCTECYPKGPYIPEKKRDPRRKKLEAAGD